MEIELAKSILARVRKALMSYLPECTKKIVLTADGYEVHVDCPGFGKENIPMFNLFSCILQSEKNLQLTHYPERELMVLRSISYEKMMLDDCLGVSDYPPFAEPVEVRVSMNPGCPYSELTFMKTLGNKKHSRWVLNLGSNVPIENYIYDVLMTFGDIVRSITSVLPPRDQVSDVHRPYQLLIFEIRETALTSTSQLELEGCRQG